MPILAASSTNPYACDTECWESGPELYDLGKCIRYPPPFSWRSIFAHISPSLHIPLCAKTTLPPAPAHMRLFSALPLLGLLLGTRASSHDSRAPATHRLDVRTPIVDVCVNLNVDLAVPVIVRGGEPLLVGLIRESTFLIIIDVTKLFPVFLKTDQQKRASVCRPFLCSSRRTPSPRRPLCSPEKMW